MAAGDPVPAISIGDDNRIGASVNVMPAESGRKNNKNNNNNSD